ncbi:5-formyltetrahydrofolate cyclo-ligase [Atopomonas sediminilitoris]|uniref:5-formyltetrahydrofolate cyclo-ligase n=1 Tax=Atopomonas sediminilitoris TaxID=2919919 RepID=UPI001F4E225B|nr:5-formyltetrahydrofolate cyclo-ligase [Atopomonas sediminilitoris]MCJ8168271.1 5-formyltetrahydrofolate cyclo-ligase [Atopomonas sediminilitoris]
MTTQPTRAQLRKALRQQRRDLSSLQQRQAARALKQRLSTHPWLRRAQHVALYLANDGEIDPAPLLQWLQRHGKQVYLPVLKRWPLTAMQFQRYGERSHWQKNRFGIAQPRFQLRQQRRIECLDVVLLPLVGFDAQGNRLGMGGGFYDRALHRLQQRHHWQGPKLIGLAHACQQVPTLPSASWDIPLHAIASDQAWHYVKSH